MPLQLICGISIAMVTATAVLLATPVPAAAISGGKESVGIFKPLDDEDLSGISAKTVTRLICQWLFGVAARTLCCPLSMVQDQDKLAQSLSCVPNTYSPNPLFRVDISTWFEIPWRCR